MLETKFGLPAEVRFCARCVISNQRPSSAVEYAHTGASKKDTIHFDAEGVCAACRFAEMKDPVKDRLKRYALYQRFGDDHFYPTVGAAVSAYLEETGVEWTDWEDRSAPTHPGSG